MSGHSDQGYLDPYKRPRPRIELHAGTSMVLVPNHTGCEGRTRITLKASHSYEVLGFGRNESGNAVFDITDGKNVFTVDTDYLPLPPY